ncbi:MAG: hypothetical protein ACI8PZ_006272 [Myxococcota bacterium]|jgi:hypothetical protein
MLLVLVSALTASASTCHDNWVSPPVPREGDAGVPTDAAVHYYIGGYADPVPYRLRVEDGTGRLVRVTRTRSESGWGTMVPLPLGRWARRQPRH